jgi:hypothetical protein
VFDFLWLEVYKIELIVHGELEIFF